MIFLEKGLRRGDDGGRGVRFVGFWGFTFNCFERFSGDWYYVVYLRVSRVLESFSYVSFLLYFEGFER